MPISEYLRGLRKKVGTDLLLMPAASMICRDAAGRVLLARHTSPPVWALPGGSIDPGEIPADAAVRELWEETGLLVEPFRLFGVYGGPTFAVTYANGDQICSVDIVYECHVVGGVLQPDNEEVESLAFYSEAEMAGLNLPQWTRLVLADLFAEQRKGLQVTHFQQTTWQPPDDGVRHAGMSDYVRNLRAKIGNDLLLMPAVGAIVLNDRGELLLQQRGDTQRWGPPLGGMDPHESPSDAIVREVWEETGLVVEPVRVLGVFGGPSMRRTFANGHQVASVFILFACRVVGGEAEPDGVESLAVRFMPIDEAKIHLSGYWAERIDLLTKQEQLARFQAATWQPT